MEVQEPRHTPTAETRERFSRWAEEGQYLLRLVPGVLDEHERVRARAEVAEQECEKLRQEVGEVSESFRRLVNEVLQPMSEALQRLRGAQKRGPSDR